MKNLLVVLILGISLAFVRSASSSTVYPFDGYVDFSSKEFSFSLKSEDDVRFSAELTTGDQKNYDLDVNLDHFNAFEHIISTSIKGVIERDKTVHGKLWSSDSIVDFQSIEELGGHFEFKDGVFYIHSFRIGGIHLSGSLQYQDDRKVDLIAKLFEVPMPDFLRFWGSDEIDSSGKVSGDIKVSGQLDAITLQGKLAAFDGHVKKLNFDSFYLNIAGEYPVLNISESEITQTDGFSFTVSGPITLGQKGTFKKQVKALTKSPLVKDSSSQIEWTIKRKEYENDSRTTELKYLRRKDNSFGSVFDDKESDMFGFEHKMKF